MTDRKRRHTARLASHGRTTVPKAVRDALGVGSGDEIAYEIEGTRVVLHKARGADSDWLRMQTVTFDEWASEADDAAYGDL